MLYVGSHALNFHFPRPMHEPKDYDLIGTYENFQRYLERLKPFEVIYCVPIDQGKKFHIKTKKPFGLAKTNNIEFEIAWPGSTAESFLAIEKSRAPVGASFASLEGLYALKMSHRYKKNTKHFLKTRNDIMTMRSILGKSDIHSDYKEWVKVREKETYNYGHPKLNQSKENFFSGDGVNYIYDHDSLHEAMATVCQRQNIDTGMKEYVIRDRAELFESIFGSDIRPAYTFYKKDQFDIYTSKQLFNELPEHVKLRGVMEEAQVLALERSVIPYKTDKDKAFKIALEKVCTSITSGWFREYAWENYDEVLKLYEKYGRDYVERFNLGLEKGIVKKFS